jgi:hypothetical protein
MFASWRIRTRFLASKISKLGLDKEIVFLYKIKDYF